MTSTFGSEERIKSKKLLEDLYANGEQINQFPFRLKYLITTFEQGPNVKIAFSVPKRNVRKAVRRNRIRRQIKEVYRLNKSHLLSQFKSSDKGLALFLIYTGKDDQTYQQLEEKIRQLLKKLQSKL